MNTAAHLLLVWAQSYTAQMNNFAIRGNLVDLEVSEPRRYTLSANMHQAIWVIECRLTSLGGHRSMLRRGVSFSG